MSVENTHFVNGHPLNPPFPEQMQQALFGMGCFWGVERKFWQIGGVFSSAVGYAAGTNANPGYQQVCTGTAGHNEVVLIVFDPQSVSYAELLKLKKVPITASDGYCGLGGTGVSCPL